MNLAESPLQLRHKVALVTGAGSGIGAATALAFAQAGARVGVLGSTAEKLTWVCERIREEGGEAFALVADVSEPTQMEQAIESLCKRWSRLDAVVANAGINGVWAPIEEMMPSDWQTTMSVNLLGTFLTVKYAVPYMRESGGTITVNASINGTRVYSNAGATAYVCSKAAQVAMTKQLALELAKHRIRVNVVCPGSIDTPIHNKTDAKHLQRIKQPVEYPEGTIPLGTGEMGKAEDVAGLMLFLASDLAKHITGTEVWIDGGESLRMG